MRVIYSFIWLFSLFRLSICISGRVPLVRSGSLTNGLSKHVRTMMKYRFGRPHAVSYEILHRRSDLGFVEAAIEQDDAEYGTPVTVGEGKDAKTFSVQFDTGSSDFWVFSNLLGNRTFNLTHVFYEPLASNTTVTTGQTFSISYGTGPVDGIVFNDTISFGGITIENQAVGAVVDMGNVFVQEFIDDGILGLAPLNLPTSIKPGNASSVLQNLFFDNPEHLQAKVFTASLTRPNETEGFFTFGFIDDELVGNKSIIYTPIIPEAPFWLFPARFVSINGVQIDKFDNKAFADTGTTLIYLSDDLLPLIYNPIGGFFNKSIQAWVIPSNFTESLVPTIVLPVDNHPVTLSPRDLAFQTIDENFIMGGIQSAGNTTTFIYGDAWLRNVYAIFDLADGKNFRFGFVPK